MNQLPRDTSEEIEAQSDSTQNRPGGMVVVLSKDLFFSMRIRTVVRQLGYVVSIAKDAPAFTNLLGSGDQRAVLGLVDFNQPIDWSELQSAIASGVPIIAFGSHMDIDGFRSAKTAGVARVISNGEFTRQLPDLAKKYARLDE